MWWGLASTHARWCIKFRPFRSNLNRLVLTREEILGISVFAIFSHNIQYLSSLLGKEQKRAFIEPKILGEIISSDISPVEEWFAMVSGWGEDVVYIDLTVWATVSPRNPVRVWVHRPLGARLIREWAQRNKRVRRADGRGRWKWGMLGNCEECGNARNCMSYSWFMLSL